MPLAEQSDLGSVGQLDQSDDATTSPSPEPEAPTYGENNKDLPDHLVRALKGLVRRYMMQEKFDRRREVLRDWRNRLYERGYQHVYEAGQNAGLTLAVPGAWVPAVGGGSVQCPPSMRNYNIFFPFQRVITSILTQNPPGIDFRADNEADSDDMEAAQVAEGYRSFFNRHNSVNEIQSAMVRMLMLSGRCVTWTRTEADPQGLGYEADGVTPVKKETADVYGTLESKISILAKDLGACAYCVLADDPDVDMLRYWYPDFKDKIQGGKPGIGENEYERIARLGIMQGTRSQNQAGDALEHVSTRQMCFLRPAAFMSDELDDGQPEANAGDEEGRPLSLREELAEIFPDGVRVCFVGEEYCGSWNESMDAHLAVDFPYAGDGMNRQAAMDPMVVLQDDFNDDMNAYWQVSNYGWPTRFIDAEDDDLDAIPDQQASPYRYEAHKARANQKLGDSFFQEPDPNIPASLWAKTLYLAGELAQFILACPPALFGENMPDQKTASGYAQARAQAMGQQGIPWMAIQRLWARIYYQAAKCALKNQPAGGIIVVPNEKGTPATYQLSKLSGNFGCYPDTDSSFPESTQAKRANLQQILMMALQAPPIGSQILASPDNWEVMKDDLGTPDLVIPEAASRNKQLAEIAVLLKNDPIKPSQQELQAAMEEHALQTILATRMGQPPPPPFDPKSLWKSSVPVQPLDFHEYEFAKCRDYLSSDDARRYEAQGGMDSTGQGLPGDVDGLENVRLHAMEHLKAKLALDSLLAPMQPPPIPPPKQKGGAHPPAPAPHPTAAPNGVAGGQPSL